MGRLCRKLKKPRLNLLYAYQIAGSADACNAGANANLYSFQSIGDLDTDRTTSLFEVAAGANADSDFIKAPGIFVQNEIE